MNTRKGKPSKITFWEMDVASFYNGRSVLITGATGYVGKVLVEKLLRSCPDLKKVYVVVRRDGKQSAAERIQKIIQLELFSRIQQECPSVLSKLVTLEGDITFTELGLSEHDISTVMEDVSVIMHVAATVRLREPLRIASKLNLEGTINVTKLARKIWNLKAFVYVSTAFSNCNRELTEEVVYPASLKPYDFLDLIESKNDQELKEMAGLILKDLPNTYTFSKLLAENYLEQYCKDLPVTITRPAIVTATWKEPFSGWSEKGVIITKMITQMGKGQMRTVLANSKVPAEFIPVDICVNQIIVAAWNVVKNRRSSQSTIPILMGVSSTINLLTTAGFHDLIMKYIYLYPSRETYNYPAFTITANKQFFKFQLYLYHYVSAVAYDVYLVVIGKKPIAIRMCSRLYTALEEYGKVLMKTRFFCCKNVLELQDLLNSKDKEEFTVSLKELDWDIYFKNYVKTTRRQILKESDCTLPQARNNLKWLYYKTVLAKVVVAILFGYCVSKVFFQ